MYETTAVLQNHSIRNIKKTSEYNRAHAFAREAYRVRGHDPEGSIAVLVAQENRG
jgi:hypothetical protein